MSTSPDSLARALDAAIGDGPPLPPVEAHLVAGRRVVRRRRVVSGLTAAAVVAVLGTTYAVAGSALDPGDPVPVAPVPATTTPTPAPTGGAVVGDLEHGPVGYEGGVLRRRLDVEIVREVADPLGRAPQATSVGLVLRYGGARHFWLLDSGPDGNGGSGASQPARTVRGSFDDWLAEQVDALGGSR